MATVTFDGPNKLLKGLSGITEHDVQIDWYSDWKEWVHLSDNAKYLPALRSIGGDDISDVQTAGDTYFLLNGWKFEPYEEDANIIIVGNVYVDDTITYGDNRWVIPAGSWQIGVEFNVSNLVDSAIAQSSEIQHASFNGMVHIDQTSPNSGTAYPAGNSEFPVNNIPDAVAIAISKGFTIFHIDGYFTVGATDNISGYDIRAGNPLTSVTTLTPGCTTTNTIFQRTVLQGTASGKMIISESYILDLAGFDGTINRSGFLGKVTLAGGNTSHIVQCYDGFEGFGEPTIDFGGSGQGLNVRDWQGGLRFENKSGTEDVSVGLNAGRLEIAADVTTGEIVVRGVGEISENLGTATVADDGLVNKAVISDEVWNEILTGATYNINSSAGKRLRQLGDAIDGSVNDPGASTTVFITNLAESRNDFYNDQYIRFTDGNLQGHVRIINDYDGGTGTITTNEPMIEAPDNGINFEILPVHIHPIKQIVDSVWDEVLTGSTHNIKNSTGKRLRDLSSLSIHEGTAQGPAANGNQIQLDLAASSTDGSYDPSMITIRDGTGVGQTRLIYQYDGATRTATVDRNWKVEPDVTSEFVIFSNAGREHVNEGLVQAGTINTITLNALASSLDDVYNYQTIFLRSGTGEDQTALVIAYNGTTKVATIEGEWAVIPDTTTGYAMLPNYYNPMAANAASFPDGVVIDAIDGIAGTIYPIGTHRSPVNNLADAKLIGAANGLSDFRVIGTLVIGATDDINGYTFTGENVLISVVVLTAGCTTEKTTFKDMIVVGPVNGSVYMTNVGLQSVTNIGADTFPTIFDRCIFRAGTQTMRTGLSTPQNTHFIECVSSAPGINTTIIDMNGTTSPVVFRKYGGNVTLLNYTGGQNSTLELNQGQIVLDATCTSGTIRIGGIYTLTDNSTLTIEERNRSIGTATWTHDIGAFEDSTSNQMAGTLLNENNLAILNKLFIEQDTATPIGSRVTELRIFRRDQSLYMNWILIDKDGNPVVLQGTGPVDRGEPNFNPL